MATANMGIDLPTRGDAGSGLWDDAIDTAIETIDAHDHSPGNGPQIPGSALAIASDVTITGAWLGCNAVGFRSVDSSVYGALSRCLFVDTAENLYFRNSGGTNVQLTDGGQLDLSSIGGITGDYAAAGASFYYDDAGSTFRALNAAPLPNDWASLSAGDLDLYYKASGSTTRVRLAAPSGMASSYALTLPGALPSATALLQSTSAGALSFNTTSNRAAIGATTIDVSGAATLSGGISGSVTVTGAVTATDFKNSSSRSKTLPAAAFAVPNTSTARLAANGRYIELLTHTGGTDTPSCVGPIDIDVGMRVSSVQIHLTRVSGSGTVTGRLKSYHQTSGTLTTVASATESASVINLSGLTLDIASNTVYWVQVEGGGTTGDLVYGYQLVYTRP